MLRAVRAWTAAVIAYQREGRIYCAWGHEHERLALAWLCADRTPDWPWQESTDGADLAELETESA